ncbi:MAG: dihydrofolate reductase [Bacteroidales bacterium]|jgi:dihydrofolate reductase|nr:dihydrofolate reductase [Bacteroidales bacterium]
MPKISIIVAADENNAIGKNKQMLWHLPYDLKNFKDLTSGHAVVMGRRTFESLPAGALPNRKNIVLTGVPEAIIDNVFVCTSIEESLSLCDKEEEVFMIGGALVYKQTLPMSDKLYLTRVHHVFKDADTFFPEIDFTQWNEIKKEEHPADEKHAYPYTFHHYLRKKME